MARRLPHDRERERAALPGASAQPLRRARTVEIAGVGDLDGEGASVDSVRPTEALYRDLFENARVAIYATDLGGNFVAVNEATEEITGFTRVELMAMNLSDLIDAADAGRVALLLARDDTPSGHEPIELRFIRKDGRQVVVEVATSRIDDGQGVVTVEGIARDKSAQQTLETQLVHQAFHDALTGLPNRALFLDRLDQAFARAERQGLDVVVMLLDLDNFKLVNDGLGHAAGDELLVAVAQRLVREVRSGETVARLGGDEFAFLIEGVPGQRELLAVAERIQSVFNEPFTVGPTAQHVKASIGIANIENTEEPSDLLRNADTAMYRAKATRTGGFELFDETISASVSRQLAIANALQDALRHHDLQLHYQPIISLAEGHLLAVEALLRWPHWQWGWVSPSEFIPLAEERGLIIAVGEYVLGEAARQAAEWTKNYPGALPLGVFVNTSPHQLRQPGFVSSFSTILDEHGLTPSDLSIEITERVLIDDQQDDLTGNLARLADLGTRLSLDDFGTGYSALSSLTKFPLTVLKIDRYFTRSMEETTDAASITKAMISLGQTLGMTVIAEGVETRDQLTQLRRFGCNAAQGFHLARPKPASKLAQLLADSR